MMGIVMPETCWAYKKYNKIISGIKLVLILQLIQVMYLSLKLKINYVTPVFEATCSYKVMFFEGAITRFKSNMMRNMNET